MIPSWLYRKGEVYPSGYINGAVSQLVGDFVGDFGSLSIFGTLKRLFLPKICTHKIRFLKIDLKSDL